MIIANDKQLITRLIKEYERNISTEDLIAFIANSDGMLAVCKELRAANDSDDQQTIGWVDEQCHQHKVDIRGLLCEIEKVLSIFHPDPFFDDNYFILGLEEGATKQEIKQAYRKLSKKYHPDTATSDSTANKEVFLQLTQAYQALLNEGKESVPFTAEKASTRQWKSPVKREVNREKKNKYIVGSGLTVLLMVIISLAVGNIYQKKAMLVGLQNSKVAFIPPTSEEKTSKKQESKPKVVPLEEEQDIQSPDKRHIPYPDLPELMQASVVPNTMKKVEEPVESGKVAKRPSMIVTPVKNVWSVPVTVRRNKNIAKSIPEIKAKSKTKIILVEPISVKRKLQPQTAEKNQAATLRKIDTFLASYIKSYEGKNVLLFTRFFAVEATENGKPLAEILPTYTNLFTKSDTINLSIMNLRWHDVLKGIELNGRFVIRIQYKNGEKIAGTGHIFFLLRDANNSFLITKLEYEFDK